MRYCKQCGKELNGKEKFCTNCGVSLFAEQGETHNKSQKIKLTIFFIIALLMFGISLKSIFAMIGVNVFKNPETQAQEKLELEDGDNVEWKFKTTAYIRETVLLDENDVKITATELSYDDITVSLNLIIENNSDKNLKFNVGGSYLMYAGGAINGYMIKCLKSLDVEIIKGERTQGIVSFFINDLLECGITEITDIQIESIVKDDHDNVFLWDIFQIETSAADFYEHTQNSFSSFVNGGGMEAIYDCTIDYHAEKNFNQGNICIVSETLIGENKNGRKELILEMVNNSTELIYFYTTSISINGLILETEDTVSRSQPIFPNTHYIVHLFDPLMIETSYLNALGIIDIKNITCSFDIMDSSNNVISTLYDVIISEDEAIIDDSGAEVYNQNGIRIISKGLFEDGNDPRIQQLHALLLIENNSLDEISIGCNTFYPLLINGEIKRESYGCVNIPRGEIAVLDMNFDMDTSTREYKDVIKLKDIKNIKYSLRINDKQDYTIAEPELSITY